MSLNKTLETMLAEGCQFPFTLSCDSLGCCKEAKWDFGLLLFTLVLCLGTASTACCVFCVCYAGAAKVDRLGKRDGLDSLNDEAAIGLDVSLATQTPQGCLTTTIPRISKGLTTQSTQPGQNAWRKFCWNRVHETRAALPPARLPSNTQVTREPHLKPNHQIVARDDKSTSKVQSTSKTSYDSDFGSFSSSSGSNTGSLIQLKQ